MVSQRKNRTSCGFTLTEILIVLGVISVLTAVLLPVFFAIRESGRRTTCASNLRQLGLSLALYVQDSDEKHPATSIANPFQAYPVSRDIGWAGRLYPYVKTTRTFQCPSDGNGDTGGQSQAVAISYALNLNVSAAPSLATFTAPADSVLLFEVTNDSAKITDVEEGISPGAAGPAQTSAAGDGVNGALLNMTGVSTSRPDGALYATGRFDNSGSADLLPTDQFAADDGRHRSGSNYLMADGHTRWLAAKGVSAGGNALSPSNPQSPQGCLIAGLGASGGYPCAEGTGGGRYRATFSVL